MVLPRSPLVWPAVCLTLGVVAFDVLSLSSISLLIWIAATAVLLVVLPLLADVPHHWRARIAQIWQTLFFILSGCTLMQLHHSASVPNFEPAPRVYRGIVFDVRPTEKVWRCTVVVPALPTAVKMEVALLRRASADVPRVGSAVAFQSTAEPLAAPVRHSSSEGYHRYLSRHGYDATAFSFQWHVASPDTAQTLRASLGRGARWALGLLELRERLAQRLSTARMPAQEEAVLSALVLGRRSDLSRPTRELFSQSGASHILALSGMHLGILLSILLFFLRRLQLWGVAGRLAASLIALAAVWGFVALTGASLSLVRAALMFSIYSLFVIAGHRGNGLHGLACAVMITVGLNPDAVFDVGFQLSVLAVAAIVVAMPLVELRFAAWRRCRWLATLLCVTLLAQTAVMPLLAYTFHRVSLVFLPSTLVAVPLAYVLLPGSALYLLLANVPILGTCLAWLLSFATHLLMASLSFLVSLPLSSVEVQPTLVQTLLAYVATFAVFALMLTRRAHWAVLMSISLLAAFLFQ